MNAYYRVDITSGQVKCENSIDDDIFDIIEGSISKLSLTSKSLMFEHYEMVVKRGTKCFSGYGCNIDMTVEYKFEFTKEHGYKLGTYVFTYSYSSE